MIVVHVTDPSQIAEARRRAVMVAGSAGFDEVARGRAAIVATELATNLVKYGREGRMLLSLFTDATGSGLEIIALDKGAGMANVGASMRDGYSSGGSPGSGLGAVQRQSQAFDIVSWPERGTAVLARLHTTMPVAKNQPAWAALAVPMPGEEVCGDAAWACFDPAGWTMLVADGLGHGPQAAQAADEAVRIFRANHRQTPGAILSLLHAGMKPTRGAAVSISRLDHATATLTFTGIGNVLGIVVTNGDMRRTVTQVGIVGHVARSIKEFTYPFAAGSTLIMHSDGIATSWALDAYPGLLAAHPSLIAAIVYRDFARGKDDATVLVAQGSPVGSAKGGEA